MPTNDERNALLIQWHKADSLCKKIDKASANGERIDPKTAAQARKWRADAAEHLRMTGWDELGD